MAGGGTRAATGRHHSTPGARYWDDVVEEFDFSPAEKREIREGADHMIAKVRARRLAEFRKRQSATQVEVAAAMGVSRSRSDLGR